MRDTLRDQIDTPALLIDLDKMERNIAKMAAFFDGVEANLRPHIKTHKCPVVAQKQIAAGAKGITCAKLGEAEVMLAHGIQDVLIANQIVGATKIRRLMHLAGRSNVIVAVDSADNVAELSEAAQAAGVTLSVLVEVDIGMHRCGVQPGEDALALARQIERGNGLRLAGIMGYEGHTVAIPDRRERETKCREAIEKLIQTRGLLEASGIAVEIVSAGGTGTYDITGALPGITEVQAGSYILMDTAYDKLSLGFECALTLLTTIISRPNEYLAITDAGMKAATTEFGLPTVKDIGGPKVAFLSEEHGILAVNEVPLQVGQKIEILPSHGCTTINLHDSFYALRGDRLEAIWEIEARGKIR